MINKNHVVLLSFLLVLACKEKESVKICSEEYRSINITFKNKSGEGRAVKDFKVVNKRTNEQIVSASTGLLKGVYVVINDSSLEKVTEAGDELIVSALDTVNNLTKSVIVKVKGGRSACHVEKLSGPEQVELE
ncbi:hypothetical protein [Pedobacter rhizosphaerae]|uniref:Uncharacterized protein n=1 Tax=Pedobacter rhizosphaerae TaxID=390241 RepID=A0A1H9LIH0_9SPHI|nr:hypothetical protein [Pedobacter rhizosphaerae]SER11216.1 hypothetical protein SAMN04488023_104162 [Pedobacter rhizosphaerae]